MSEERLNLVDVEPGGNAPLEVRVHPIAHGFQRGEHAKHAHVGGEVVQVDVGDAVVEADVGLAVEERQRAGDVSLVAKGYVARLRLRLLDE